MGLVPESFDRSSVFGSKMQGSSRLVQQDHSGTAMPPQTMNPFSFIQSTSLGGVAPQRTTKSGPFTTPLFGGGKPSTFLQPRSIWALHGSPTPPGTSAFGITAPSTSVNNTTYTPRGSMPGLDSISSAAQAATTPNIMFGVPSQQSLTPKPFGFFTAQAAPATSPMSSCVTPKSPPTNDSNSRVISNMFAFQSNGGGGSGSCGSTTASQRVRRIAQPKGRFGRGGDVGR
jgi:hypothetical protein